MTKNRVEVRIGGQVFSLQGNESEKHIQKAAALLNKKVMEVQKNDPMHRWSSEKRQMLIALNLADECVKLETDLERFTQELEKCNEENLALLDRVEEMALEISQLKMIEK
ncbi:MAG: cell division protein ZapA [Niameybacter sp.]|uniref:cell division protein ZapA n=1 Tax=Niameybacter sp. TaxID=2033640 RepID=UPI002FC9B0D9